MSVQSDVPAVRMVCGSCGSINVFAPAYVKWNVGSQEWELFQMFEKVAHCQDCERETRMERIES